MQFSFIVFYGKGKKQKMRVSFCHATEGEILKNILVSFYNIITMNEAVFSVI